MGKYLVIYKIKGKSNKLYVFTQKSLFNLSSAYEDKTEKVNDVGYKQQLF
jgi:hypothetical protein